MASSLAEIHNQADLIVLGSIRSLRGVATVPEDVVRATLSIAEILKGEPKYSGAGEIEVEVGIEWSIEDLPPAPNHDSLWFLSYESRHDVYNTVDYLQISVLRNIDGAVGVILPESIANAFSASHFPVPLDGTSFEDLIVRVRELTPRSTVDVVAKKGLADSERINRWGAC